jgi:hypothetical protein
MTLPDHPYRPMIERICLMTKPVPPDVIEAMMLVESNAVPSALSPSGAMGLLQIIYKYHAAAVDKAATDLGKRWGELALYDPEINLLAGTRILRWCYTSDGSQSWERAVRKYHSGSADPPADFKDGLGTTSDQHIAKFRAALEDVEALRNAPFLTPPTGGTPVALDMTKGLIPLPKHEKKIITTKYTGFSSVGKRTIRGESLHRAQGSFVSIYSHFSNPNVASLTDWAVDHMTGQMWQFNDPEGTRSGWASGPYKGGYGDGKAFAEKYIPLMGIGAEVINRDRESVEVSGYFRQPGSGVTTDNPWSDVSKRVYAQFLASRAHDYGIAWGDFPIARPKDDFSFLAWHQEFILPAYSTESFDKICPGRVVMEATPEVIEIAKGIMKSYQEKSIPTPTTPPAADPTSILYPSGMDAGIAAIAFGSVKGDDGRTYAYDPRGPVSRLWLDLGWAGSNESRFPRLEEVRTFDKRRYFLFSDGLIIWQPDANTAIRVIGIEAPDNREA